MRRRKERGERRGERREERGERREERGGRNRHGTDIQHTHTIILSLSHTHT